MCSSLMCFCFGAKEWSLRWSRLWCRCLKCDVPSVVYLLLGKCSWVTHSSVVSLFSPWRVTKGRNSALISSWTPRSSLFPLLIIGEVFMRRVCAVVVLALLVHHMHQNHGAGKGGEITDYIQWKQSTASRLNLLQLHAAIMFAVADPSYAARYPSHYPIGRARGKIYPVQTFTNYQRVDAVAMWARLMRHVHHVSRHINQPGRRMGKQTQRDPIYCLPGWPSTSP